MAEIDAGNTNEIPEQVIRELLTAATKLYVARRTSGDAAFSPFLDGEVTATEAAITTTAMLDAVELQLFELTLWNSLGAT